MASKTEKKEDVLWRRILRSKFFIVFSVIILVVLVVFLGQVINRKYQVAEEIKKTKEKQVDLRSENDRLADLLEYLKTDTYKDKVARKDLGLQKEGETVVVIEEDEEAAVPEENLLTLVEKEEEVSTYVPTYREWWDYFFANKD